MVVETVLRWHPGRLAVSLSCTLISADYLRQLLTVPTDGHVFPRTAIRSHAAYTPQLTMRCDVSVGLPVWYFSAHWPPQRSRVFLCTVAEP